VRTRKLAALVDGDVATGIVTVAIWPRRREGSGKVMFPPL